MDLTSSVTIVSSTAKLLLLTVCHLGPYHAPIWNHELDISNSFLSTSQVPGAQVPHPLHILVHSRCSMEVAGNMMRAKDIWFWRFPL